ERPDVDAVYMTATQAMTGQGGWPMTVFATPTGDPFFCGTYYPREAFARLVQAVSQAWRDQRADVVAQGAAVVEAIGRSQGQGFSAVPGSITADLLDAAAESLHREYDPTNAGFGGAPKFPPHMALLFLLRRYQRTGDERSLEIVRHTCEAMARGGIYDQLAGGFARYSVDDKWIVPHFEKMLYDNALLLRVYTNLWRLTGDALALRVARETAEFLGRDLGTAHGGLASALDADTAGVEGLTYAWTPDELAQALGDETGAWAADLFGVTRTGTFEHGKSVLRLARDIDAAAPEIGARWQDVRTWLREAREKRPQPDRDDKVITAWNALAVTALAEFASMTRDAAVTGSRDATIPGATVTEGRDATIPGATVTEGRDATVPEATVTEGRDAAVTDGPAGAAGELARRAAQLLADRHVAGGRLRRASRDGVVGEPAGVLEDYGAAAEAFCAVHQLTGDGAWLRLAGQLLDVALAHFADGNGGFYDTADDAERLVTRPADPTDNATPSGLSAMVAALTAYSALTGETRYREAALGALETIAPVIGKHPRYIGYSAATAEALVSGPYEIAIATDGGAHQPLAEAAWRLAPPGSVIVVGTPDTPGVPLLEGRPLVDGWSTAYVCRGFVCDRPVTTVDDLVGRLSRVG
nr:uncharacterized protein [Micromonosporaceae bacterium]